MRYPATRVSLTGAWAADIAVQTHSVEKRDNEHPCQFAHSVVLPGHDRFLNCFSIEHDGRKKMKKTQKE